MNKIGILSRMLDYLLGVSLLMLNSEAAIDGWTEPPISKKADGDGTAATTFPENLSPGHLTGININATADQQGKDISYFLISQSVKGMFTIDQSSGAVTFVKGVLDFEKTPTYFIEVRASDKTSTNGTANITLQLTNSPPAFSPKAYNAQMCDGAKAGTTLVTVKAVDPGNTNVTYAIQPAGNTNSDFKIDGAGIISVAATKTLNMTATKTYALVVEASDTASGTGTATVNVVMKVCNSGTSPITIAVTTLLLSLLVKLL